MIAASRAVNTSGCVSFRFAHALEAVCSDNRVPTGLRNEDTEDGIFLVRLVEVGGVTGCCCCCCCCSSCRAAWTLDARNGSAT